MTPHFKEAHHRIEPANFSKVLNVVAEGTKDDLVLLVGAVDDHLYNILLVWWVATTNEVNLGIVLNNLAKGIGHYGLVRLINDAFDLTVWELLCIFADILLDGAAFCSKYAHQCLSYLMVEADDGGLGVYQE